MSVKKRKRRWPWNLASLPNWSGEYLGPAATRVSWVWGVLHEFAVGGDWRQTWGLEMMVMISSRELVGIAESVEWWKCVKAWKTYGALDTSESMWLVQK